MLTPRHLRRPQLRMDKRHRRRSFSERTPNSLMRKDQGILSVIPGDLRVVPDPRAQIVVAEIPKVAEQLRPIVRPLLIHMVSSALSGNCSRKRDHISSIAEAFDEYWRHSGRQMLRYLE